MARRPPVDATAVLRHGAKRLGVAVTDAAIATLARYAAELEKWNARINLVGPGTLAEFLELHFLDSLTLAPTLDGLASPDGPVRLLDVGTGAGFPGLVLKIARPHLDLVLLDPRQKRGTFLRHMVRTLGLAGVAVVEGRLPEDAPIAAKGGLFQAITCRALTDLSSFLALAEPLLAPQGRILCMKGPRAEQELGDWQEVRPSAPSLVLENHVETSLPFSGASRQILIFSRAGG